MPRLQGRGIFLPPHPMRLVVTQRSARVLPAHAEPVECPVCPPSVAIGYVFPQPGNRLNPFGYAVYTGKSRTPAVRFSAPSQHQAVARCLLALLAIAEDTPPRKTTGYFAGALWAQGLPVEVVTLADGPSLAVY